ncbi:MAG: hypothetical protein IIA45_02240 [Bacteroidetes bacterium]|nr:hypothetical protein [Bacteroidota bacterium]
MPVVQKNISTYSILLIAVLAVLGFIGLLNHEMWRDELEIWLLSRDSTSIGNLLANMYTEAHPALWYIPNFIIARFTHDPFSMQMFHLVIALSSAFVFFRYAPFPVLHKVLFCFGYFMFYEYTIISRSYGLEFLLIFIFCYFYKDRFNRYLTLAVLLFLIANTNLYGTVIAANLGLILILEPILSKDARSKLPPLNLKLIFGITLFGAGIILGLGHILLQTLDWGYFSTMSGTEENKDFNWFAKNYSVIANAYLPVSNFEYGQHFWNKNFLVDFPDPAVPVMAKQIAGMVLSTLFLIISISILAKRRLALILFLFGTVTMFILIAFIWHGQLRHHGQIFMLFIISMWLTAHMTPKVESEKVTPGNILSNLSGVIFKYRLKFLLVLFSIHVFAGLYAYRIDLKHPFSQAEQTGKFLSDEKYKDLILVGSNDYAAQAVTAYIDKQIYYPESRRFGTFVIWNQERKEGPGPGIVLNDAFALMQENQKNVMLVMNYMPFESNPMKIGDIRKATDNISINFIAAFQEAIVIDESFYLFHVYFTE